MHFSDLFLFKNHFWPKIIFLLVRYLWLPGVHCILVLFFRCWYSGFYITLVFFILIQSYTNKYAKFSNPLAFLLRLINKNFRSNKDNTYFVLRIWFVFSFFLCIGALFMHYGWRDPIYEDFFASEASFV